MIFADTEGRTPLHWAVDRGHLSAVEVLAKANADLNAKVYLKCLHTYCILFFSRTPYLLHSKSWLSNFLSEGGAIGASNIQRRRQRSAKARGVTQLKES